MNFIRVIQATLLTLVLIFCSSFALAKSQKGSIVICKIPVSLHTARTIHSQSYSSVSKGTKLVVAAEKDGWSGIVMEDGRMGWAPSEYFEATQYQAVYSRPTRTLASRSLQRALLKSGNAVTQTAVQYLGVPYVWGGNTPNQGMDCSGYVKYVFGKLGMSLPRRATHQMYVGQIIKKYEDLQPGDRLYFSDKYHSRISHTGIYLGQGYFIHANRGANMVSTSYLFERRWMKICVGARR